MRKQLYKIIFESNTPAGKLFDIALIFSILLSVLVVMLDTVQEIHDQHGELMYSLEWFFTLLFTIEYILRLYCINEPMKYARSFFGVIDLISIVPTYVSLLVPGTQYLLVIRSLRVLRIFRVLKFVQFMKETKVLKEAMLQSRRKITLFLFFIVTIVVIFGSLMYLIEAGEESQFTSIPTSVYWAIVTLTTVGYGDISPQTPLGQFIASLIMITGYSIIAVPTGILSAEMTRLQDRSLSVRVCSHCSKEGHDYDALYCKECGEKL